jgi:hypothetical protein
VDRISQHQRASAPDRFFDLTAARKYLGELGRELVRAGSSPDPRVVHLALAVIQYQGRERVQ